MATKFSLEKYSRTPESERGELEAFVRFAEARISKGRALGRDFRFEHVPENHQVRLFAAAHEGDVAGLRKAATTAAEGRQRFRVNLKLLEETIKERVAAELEADKASRKAKTDRKVVPDPEVAKAAAAEAEAAAILKAAESKLESFGRWVAQVRADCDVVKANLERAQAHEHRRLARRLHTVDAAPNLEAEALEKRAAQTIDPDLAAGLRERAQELRKAPAVTVARQAPRTAPQPTAGDPRMDGVAVALLNQRGDLGLVEAHELPQPIPSPRPATVGGGFRRIPGGIDDAEDGVTRWGEKR